MHAIAAPVTLPPLSDIVSFGLYSFGLAVALYCAALVIIMRGRS